MLYGEPVNAEWVEGNWGQAFFFDGDDALVIADNELLDMGAVLMLAWINPSRLTTDAGVAIVMNKEDVYEFGLQDNTAHLQSAFSPCWRWFGTIEVPLEQWTHVGAGVDGTNERHFMNGAIAEETSCAGALTPNDAAFKIGARGGNGGHSSQFAGSIDEAMLFDTCCDDAAVAAVYESFAANLSSAEQSICTPDECASCGCQCACACTNCRCAGHGSCVSPSFECCVNNDAPPGGGH